MWPAKPVSMFVFDGVFDDAQCNASVTKRLSCELLGGDLFMSSASSNKNKTVKALEKYVENVFGSRVCPHGAE